MKTNKILAIALAAILSGGILSSCDTKEEPVSNVTISPASVSISPGGTATLTATVLPDNAADKTVTWSSGNPAIATVSDGVVTAVSLGTAVITVTTQDGGKTATCTVNVTPVAVTGVSLNETSATITTGAGGTLPLTATVEPEEAPNKAVTWESSHPAVATVSDGLVTAVSAGATTITVTTKDGGQTATCEVTVASVAATGVELNRTTAKLNLGGTTTLTATVLPATATNKAVTWSSSASTVATVNSNGVVTALAEGSTTITVTTQDGNKTAICEVTVARQITMTTGKNTTRISVQLKGTGAATIDWGDGETESYTLNEYYKTISHNYADLVNHTIAIVGEVVDLACIAGQGSNLLTSLDVSGATALLSLYLEKNGLSVLNVNGCTALTKLTCNGNPIRSLDVSSCAALEHLEVFDTPLASLDISNNVALERLDCYRNQLTSLDVSGCTALTIMNATDNQITSLNVSGCTALTRVGLVRNRLSTLDMSDSPALTHLLCYSNLLSATALNDLFGTLHTNVIQDGKTVYMANNPGSTACDQNIAAAKGWSVDNISY